MALRKFRQKATCNIHISLGKWPHWYKGSRFHINPPAPTPGETRCLAGHFQRTSDWEIKQFCSRLTSMDDGNLHFMSQICHVLSFVKYLTVPAIETNSVHGKILIVQTNEKKEKGDMIYWLYWNKKMFHKFAETQTESPDDAHIFETNKVKFIIIEERRRYICQPFKRSIVWVFLPLKLQHKRDWKFRVDLPPFLPSLCKRLVRQRGEGHTWRLGRGSWQLFLIKHINTSCM